MLLANVSRNILATLGIPRAGQALPQRNSLWGLLSKVLGLGVKLRTVSPCSRGERRLIILTQRS